MLLTSPKRKEQATHGRVTRGHHQSVKGGGDYEQKSLLWFPWERAEKAGLGSASLNSFSGLWDLGAVYSFLVPDPGGLRQVERVMKCESP